MQRGIWLRPWRWGRPRLAITAFLLLLIVGGWVALGGPHRGTRYWYQEHTYHFQALRALQYAPYQAADANEVLTAVGNTVEGDHESWYRAWYDVAAAVERMAGTYSNPRDRASALLRAHNYLRTAEFFLPGGDPRRVDAWRKQTMHFETALDLLGVRREKLRVPYQGKFLNAVFYPADQPVDLEKPLIVGGDRSSSQAATIGSPRATMSVARRPPVKQHSASMRNSSHQAARGNHLQRRRCYRVSESNSAVTRNPQSRRANRARWVLLSLLLGCSPRTNEPRLPPRSAASSAGGSLAAENAPIACPCADLGLAEVRARLAQGRLERAARLLRRTEHRCGCRSRAARELERSVLAELGQPTDVAGRAALRAECARDRATAEAPPSIQTWYDRGIEEIKRDDRAEARRWLDRALWRLERWGRCRFGGGMVAADAFMGLTDEARALDGSPDGKMVAVANGREIVVFEIPPAGDSVDAAANQAYRYSLHPPARAMAVAWPRNDRMVVATSSNQLLLYHPPSGRLLAERTVPGMVDYGIAALARSELVVTAHRDKTVRFWHLKQLAPAGSLSTPEHATSLSVAEDGVAVGLGEAGLVVFRGPLSTRSLATLPMIAVPAVASRVAISPDSRRVVWSGPEGGGEVDLTTDTIRELPDLRKRCVLFTPAGRLVTCTWEIEVERDGGQVVSFDPGGSGWTTYADVKALAGGRLVAAVTSHGQFRVWDTAEENPANITRLAAHPNSAAIPIDVCESAGAVLVGGLVWRPQSGQLTRLESAGANAEVCVAGRWLVTAPISGELMVHDLQASPPSKPRRLPVGDYVGMLYGRANGELVMATGDARLLVGSVNSSLVREIARGTQYGLGGYTHRQAFRDRRLVAGDGWIALSDGRTVFWKDTTRPSRPRQLPDVIGGELATDAAGRYLVIGDHEGNIEVRDARGALRSRWPTERIPITALAVHPKEPWIAWGDQVGTIRIVSLEGKPVGIRVDSAGSRVGALRFFGDEWLVSSAADQRIRFWSIRHQRSGPILVRHAATSYVVSTDPIPFLQPLDRAARDALRCHLGAYSWGFELCSDRFEVPNLGGRLFAHDPTYREP